MSETITRPATPTRTDTRVQPTTGDGDHDRLAHYVWGRNPRAMITESMVTGTPVRALCGKLWVPSRDASRYPVCPECQEIKAGLQRGRGSDGGDGGT